MYLMYLKENIKKKKAFTKGYNGPWRHSISFSIQLARILIALSPIQQHSAKLFIHSSLRPGMSGRSLPISTTLRISNDGIQRKLDVELLEKESPTKKLNLWDFNLCQLHDWVKKCICLHELNKTNKPITFMIIKEKRGKKGRENTEDDLQTIKHEITKDVEESEVNMPNKKLHPTILCSIMYVLYSISLILK